MKTIAQQIESLTMQMNRLEEIIQREQRYIYQHGKKNDEGEQDAQWIEYKEDAERNLQKWDMLKAKRDELKAQL